LATPQEESKGIDGYIGDTPVSIKPRTYKLMKHLQDNIDVKIILYEKKHDGVLVDASEVLNE
ncbi:MjaI family restriction endonuclease, partial [bacterium]|nr:MjaI family restriction endonuclease [bacterium]